MSALKEFTVLSVVYLYIYIYIYIYIYTHTHTHTEREDMCNSIIILPRFQVRESF